MKNLRPGSLHVAFVCMSGYIFVKDILVQKEHVKNSFFGLMVRHHYLMLFN